MCQEKEVEEESLALKIVWIHQFEDSKITFEKLTKEKVQGPVTVLAR